MIDLQKIRETVDQSLEGTDLYRVDVTCSRDNDIEITIDSDSQVDIEHCERVSRTVEATLNRDEEDFSLTVTSAGLGYPLTLLRQLRRTIGHEVELVLCADSHKIKGVLTDADEQKVTVTYPEKIAIEGKKRKQTVETRREFPHQEIRSIREVINVK